MHVTRQACQNIHLAKRLMQKLVMREGDVYFLLCPPKIILGCYFFFKLIEKEKEKDHYRFKLIVHLASLLGFVRAVHSCM